MICEIRFRLEPGLNKVEMPDLKSEGFTPVDRNKYASCNEVRGLFSPIQDRYLLLKIWIVAEITAKNLLTV